MNGMGMRLKNKMSVIVIALLGWLSPFAFAEDSAVSKVETAASAQATGTQRGTLYRVRHKGNTSYLFGTIHVGKPSFYPLGKDVEQALAQSSKVALEIDSQQTQAMQLAMQKHGMYKAGDSIKNHLTPAHLAQLKQALEQFKLPLENVVQMKPWLVASMLMELDLQRNGYQISDGIEAYLQKIAKQQKKQVVELESADLQLALFNGLSDADQEQFLTEVLIEIESGKSRQETDELANAWMSADAREFTRLIDEMLSEKTMSAEFTRKVLLDQRNPGIASKIEALLKHDKVTFVGVGLLHLVGEKSVPALLRERGYEVVRVY